MIARVLAQVMDWPVEGFLTFQSRFERDGLVCVGLVALIVFLATSTRRTAKRCPRCREINREQARFCAQCGSPLR